MEYLDFDLLFRRENGHYRAAVVHSPGGEASVSFALPFTEMELENFLLKIGQPRRGNRRLDTPQINALKIFGEKLFSAVFQGELSICLQVSLAEARNLKSGLRIRLRMSEATELADLPWEYLYNPSSNGFLTLNTETPIVRYMDLAETIEPLRVQEPLRVLVVVSSPSDAEQLDVEDECRRLLDATRKWRDEKTLIVDILKHPTLPSLQTCLQESRYHVLHFIGHGGFDEQSQTGLLYFEDDRGNSKTVAGELFAALLGNHRSIRLVVLNACEGARTSRLDPFAGVSQSLLQRGIPAAIAMQFEISDRAARIFAERFYGAIVRGYSVDSALVEARTALYVEQLGAEWGTPVLFMRAPDGRIFDVQRDLDDTPFGVTKPIRELGPGHVISRPSKWRRLTASRNVVAATTSVLVFCALVAGSFLTWRHYRPSLKLPRLAVVGPTNDTGDSRYDWLGTEIADRISANLDLPSELTVIPREDIVRAQEDVAISPDKCSAGGDTTSAPAFLDASYLIFGSFHLTPSKSSEPIHVSLCIQTAEGNTLSRFEKNIPEDEGRLVAAEATEQFREVIGNGKLRFRDLQDIYPQSPMARRLYFEGVSQIRRFNAREAVTNLKQAASLEGSNFLIHSALADAWSALHHDSEAAFEAQEAWDRMNATKSSFPLEYRTELEARRDEMNNKWDGAIDNYSRLYNAYPERLDYGLKLSRVQLSASKVTDAIGTLDRLSALPSPLGKDPRILIQRARALQVSSNFDAAIKAADNALQIASERKEQAAQANALLELCWAYIRTGSTDKAMMACDRSHGIFDGIDDDVSAAIALNDMAIWLSSKGRYTDAKLAYDRVIAIDTAAHAQQELAGVLLNSANVSVEQDNLAEAERLYSQSLQVSASTGDRYNEARAHVGLADIYWEEGDLEKSGDHASTALRLAQGVDPSVEAAALSALAYVQSENGDLFGALTTNNKALTIRQTIKAPGDIATTESRIGDTYFRMGNLEEATKMYEAAREQYTSLGKVTAVAQLWLSLAEVNLSRGSYVEAGKNAMTALSLSDKKDSESRADAMSFVVRSLIAQGKLDEARVRFKDVKALDYSDDIDTRLDVAMAEGLLLTATGEASSAIGILRSAATDAEQSGRRFASFLLKLAAITAQEKAGDHDAARKELAMLRVAAQRCFSKSSSEQACGFKLISDKAALLAGTLQGG